MLGAIVSTPNLTLKFPSLSGEIVSIRADLRVARQCYLDSLKVGKKKSPEVQNGPSNQAFNMIELDPREDSKELRPQPADDTELFQIGKMTGQNVKLGFTLEVELKIKNTGSVARKWDLFAWSAPNMPSIDPSFVCHRLNMDPQAKPVAQQRRKLGGDRREAIRDETKKPLDARFIREADYTTWLANVVLVKKSNGKWRMCTNYTNLFLSKRRHTKAS